MEQTNPVTRLVNDTVAGRISEEVILVIQPEPWLLSARLQIDMATKSMSETAIAAADRALSPAAKSYHREPRDGWDEVHSNDRRGVAWRSREDGDLKDGFERGESLNNLSDTHSRSNTAILARLVKLGYLNQDSRGTYYDLAGNAWASR